MRRLAGELEADSHDAEQIHVADPLIEPVDHHRRVHVLEDAGLNQLHLAASALLGRRAHHVDAPLRQPVAHRGQPGARAGARGRDRVVTAGVTDRRQRVVLAHDRDRRALAGLDRRAKRGLDAGHAALDLEALRGEELREPGGCLDLLITELGIVVDPARELLEVVAEAIDRAGDRVFESGHLHVSLLQALRDRTASMAVNYITAVVC